MFVREREGEEERGKEGEREGERKEGGEKERGGEEGGKDPDNIQYKN